MKKVTVYMNDKTIEILDTIAQSQTYYKYPLYQAYGLILDEIVSELSLMSKALNFPRCLNIVTKPVSYEDACLCCADFKRVVAESEIGSPVAVYVKSDKNGRILSVECPYCHTELALNEEGMIIGVVKEV